MDHNKLHKKLRLQDKSNLCVLGAPRSFQVMIGALSYSQEPGSSPETYDAVMLFAKDLSALEKLMTIAVDLGPADVLFWACYPKLSSDLKSDISRTGIFETAQRFGLRPVTQVAIDDTWSAMRLRPPDRVGKK